MAAVVTGLPAFLLSSQEVPGRSLFKWGREAVSGSSLGQKGSLGTTFICIPLHCDTTPLEVAAS